jgi:predicted helicase
VKFEDDSDVYTLSGHLKGLTNSIWSELDDTKREGTDRKPYINSFRRNLQRNHLEMLMNLVLTDPDGTVPADANAIARNCVSKLSDKIGKTLADAKLDDTTEAHLNDVKKRIDKALEAQYSIGGLRASDFLFFFREAAKQKDAKPVSVLPD